MAWEVRGDGLVGMYEFCSDNIIEIEEFLHIDIYQVLGYKMWLISGLSSGSLLHVLGSDSFFNGTLHTSILVASKDLKRCR